MPTIRETGQPYPNNAVIDFGPLPPGDRGTAATVQVIRAIIRSTDRSGWARQLAQKWVEHFNTAETDAIAVNCAVPRSIAAIWLGCKAYWRFRRDPAGQEWTAHPDHFIRLIQQGWRAEGDCDDRAAFTAALTRGAGYDTVLIVAGREPGGRFEHIYPGIILAGRTVPLDSQECAQPGMERPAARRKVYRV